MGVRSYAVSLETWRVSGERHVATRQRMPARSVSRRTQSPETRRVSMVERRRASFVAGERHVPYLT